MSSTKKQKATPKGVEDAIKNVTEVTQTEETVSVTEVMSDTPKAKTKTKSKKKEQVAVTSAEVIDEENVVFDGANFKNCSFENTTYENCDIKIKK